MSNITKYTRDAFKSLALLEDTDFDLTGKDSFQKIDDFINDDIPVDTEVIDLDAETEEEVKDSYVGDVILDCPVCHTNLFKNIDDVVIDEETNLCCVGEVCPVCGQEDGFTILGKVAPFEEETEEAEVEVTTEPDDFEVDIEDKEEELKEAFRNRKNSRKLQEKVSKRILKNGRNTKSLTEDTVKQNGKWVNKGKEGTHGKFNTKKAADAQRKAMFANGYKEAVETRDVTDQVIVKRGKPGFISKMHKLRDQGYKCISSGDGQMCFAKPKELKTEKCEALTESKHDLQKLPQDIQDIVGEHFGYTMDFDFLDIVADVLLRVDDFENEDLWETVDSTLIYADDQWEVLEHYVDSPADLNDGSWDDAFAQFVNDLEEICRKVATQRGGEEVTESKKLEGNKKLSESNKPLRKYYSYKITNGDLTDTVTQVGEYMYTIQHPNKRYVKNDRASSGSDDRLFTADQVETYKNGMNMWIVDESVSSPTKGKKLSEEVSDYAKEDIKREIERIVDEYFDGTDFSASVSNVDFDAGKVTLDISALGGYDDETGESEELSREVEFDIPNLDLEDYFAAQLEDWMNTHNSPDSFYESKELTEAPIYDLHPQFDSRKSFYSKAKVDTGYKGDKNKLYSYGTLVAEIKDGKPVVYGTYSQTTLRHIKDWLKQNGFKAENSKQILADYGVKSESLKEEVSDIAYAIADEIDERFANAKFISWDEFNEAFEDACPITIDWTDDYFNDLETDVRGILSYKGWETIFEGEDEGGLRLLESKSSKHSIDSKILKKFKAKRDESLKEDIEKATIETEDQVIEVKSEEKEPIEEEEVHSEEEMVAPLTDDEIADIEDNSEESVEEEPVEEVEETEEETVESNPEDEEEFDFDEIQEESFKRITESYLKKTYSNIKSFNIEDAKLVENKLTLNGTIEFNSGKKKNTSFVFEKVDDRSTIARSKARFVGLNETFTDKKNAYVLKVRKDDKTLVAESLRYNYPAKTSNLNESVKVVKGLVK